MPKELPYTSSIKDMPLMFSEMKRTALLLCEGKSVDEIVSLSMDKNIYQLEKEKRRRDVPFRMIKRFSAIGQVCFDAGAKKILLPMSSAVDIASVPADLFSKFQTSFYTSPEDAVFKALGLE